MGHLSFWLYSLGKNCIQGWRVITIILPPTWHLEICGVKEFSRWFQGPWMTLPLLPDFDLKISHFWPPHAHAGRMAGAKTALNHVFLLVLMWFEVIKSFHDESPSQTDPAIVTWFWPKNHPFLRPLCSWLKHGDGQNCFKPAWYMSIEDACATGA